MSTFLKVSFVCLRCKAVLRNVLEETDMATEWAIALTSPTMCQAICPYCEDKSKTQLRISIVDVDLKMDLKVVDWDSELTK